jgi:hypothetical protein
MKIDTPLRLVNLNVPLFVINKQSHALIPSNQLGSFVPVQHSWSPWQPELTRLPATQQLFHVTTLKIGVRLCLKGRRFEPKLSLTWNFSS